MSVIGYLVHEFGYTPAEFAKGLSAPDIWDACPTQLKLSVILTVGALEWSTETQTPHYMNGGTRRGRADGGRAPYWRDSYERQVAMHAVTMTQILST